MRRQEAQELRNHIDRVMKEAPDVPLLVYGDLNDTKEQPAIQEVLGDRQSPTHLTDLWLSDYTGDHWTYYQKDKGRGEKCSKLEHFPEERAVIAK